MLKLNIEYFKYIKDVDDLKKYKYNYSRVKYFQEKHSDFIKYCSEKLGMSEKILLGNFNRDNLKSNLLFGTFLYFYKYSINISSSVIYFFIKENEQINFKNFKQYDAVSMQEKMILKKFINTIMKYEKFVNAKK